MRAVGWPPPKSSPRFSLPGACSGNKHVVSILADFLPWNMSIIRCTAAGSHKRSVKNFQKSWRRFYCSCPAATGLRCCCPRDQGCSWPGFSGASAAEARIRRFLRISPEAHGYPVHATRLGRDALRCAHREPNLVILDLGLPDGDTMNFILRLREWSRVAIILLKKGIRAAALVD